MKRELAIALRMTAATLLLAGIVYPLAVTGLARLLVPRQAGGSLVRADGRAIGSALIGQRFRDASYFQGRPSAAGSDGYDGLASGGSNLGPTSKRLWERVGEDLARLRRENPHAEGPPPPELLSASASGLDPDLTPEAARWQVPRIASARGVPAASVESLLAARIEPSALAFLGEPRVNVLLANLALDERFGRSAARR
ncbi:MAG TPA: potassium-transporting ATPase subunit KdpC [Candidatus Eisenbacteria bacterium]|nr:potassium-transporting ATPase subunit KdpC [Candidatus Eisenbacteria bacterium]